MLNEADVEVYKEGGYFSAYLKANPEIATSAWLTRERAVSAINRIIELRADIDGKMDSITFWKVDPVSLESDGRYIIKLNNGSYQVAHFEICEGEDGEDDKRYFVPLEHSWFYENEVAEIYEFPYKGE